MSLSLTQNVYYTFVKYSIICIEMIHQKIKMKGPRGLEHTDTDPIKHSRCFKTGSQKKYLTIKFLYNF